MRIVLFGLIALFFCSCQDNSTTIEIEGTAQGMADGTELLFQKLNENNQPYIVDTIIINNESFSFELEKKGFPEIGLLTFQNVNSNVIFFIENKDLNATIYKDSIYSSKVTGSRENDLFNSFTADIKKYNAKKQANMEEFQEARKNMDNNAIVRLQTENAVLANEEKVFKKEFVEKNNNTLIALMMLNEMYARQEINAQETQRLLEGVNPKLENNNILIMLRKSLDAAKIAELGSIAPDFSGPAPDGSTLSLQEAMGKVTLIDFWASWCRPCRVENPNVVRVHNQYKDKGFNVISVSLDRPDQREQWLKAIEDDKMDWYHISNLQFWNDPIAKQYGVRAIPATYILDETGRIIAKDVRGPALGQKIGELLGDTEGAL